MSEYGGSPGLVVNGEPAPALLAAVTPAPGSYLANGKLQLSAERNRTATLNGKVELPAAFTLEAKLSMREAWANDGNLALRFNVGEAGQQAYLLVLRHQRGMNQIALSKARQRQAVGAAARTHASLDRRDAGTCAAGGRWRGDPRLGGRRGHRLGE